MVLKSGRSQTNLLSTAIARAPRDRGTKPKLVHRAIDQLSERTRRIINRFGLDKSRNIHQVWDEIQDFRPIMLLIHITSHSPFSKCIQHCPSWSHWTVHNFRNNHKNKWRCFGAKLATMGNLQLDLGAFPSDHSESQSDISLGFWCSAGSSWGYARASIQSLYASLQ